MHNETMVLHDPFIPITRQLQMATVPMLLESDQEVRDANDKSVLWFADPCDRRTAEAMLLSHYERKKNDGTFLVRRCSGSLNDFSISVVHQSAVFNYRLTHHGDCYFTIADSRIFFGLEKAVEYFKTHKELVCYLTEPLDDCLPIPQWTRSTGIITILHKACAHGSVSLVDKILGHPDRGDIDERDPSGSTALHIASSFGHDDVVEHLLAAGASPTKNDSNGRTPLHKAVEEDHPSTALLLVEWGAELTAVDKYKSTPLHEAARNNSFACVRALLQCRAPLRPRDNDGKTPLQLAKENGAVEAAKILRSHSVPSSQLGPEQWFHPSCSKDLARELFQSSGNTDGLFLVRPSETKKCYVLSMIAQSDLLNYEILKDEDGYYSISDGPLFSSISEMVDHYMHFQDRLYTQLKKPVESNYSFKGNSRRPSLKDVGNRNAVSQQWRDEKTYKSRDKVRSTRDAGHRERQNSDGPRSQSRFHSLILRKTAELRQVARSAFVNGDDDATPSPQVESKNISPQKYASKAVPLLSKENKPNVPVTNSSLSSRASYKTLKVTGQSDAGLKTINLEQLEFIKKIGEGEFGIVYEGSFNQEEGVQPISVAIKALKHMSPEAVADFKREAKIMGELKHHCIVKIYGIVEEQNELLMVQELIHHGSVLHMLRRNPQNVTINHLKKWAMQIANALSYMESKRFVHRDLSARNVLIATFNQVKVCDFGLSRHTVDDIYEAHSEGKIPVKWYAIEAIEQGRFSSKSDVWSYGVTLWEMFTYGKEPYGRKTGAEVYDFIKGGNKLEKPQLCPESTYEIMCSCWDLDENRRPTFKSLVKYFDEDAQFKGIHKIIRPA